MLLRWYEKYRIGIAKLSEPLLKKSRSCEEIPILFLAPHAFLRINIRIIFAWKIEEKEKITHFDRPI